VELKLDATVSELKQKGPALLEELAKAFSEVRPDLSEALEKALPTKEVQLKYRALRELKTKTDKAYRETLDAMLKDIGRVLDRAVVGVSKSLDAVEDKLESMEKGEPDTQEMIRSLLRRRPDLMPKFRDHTEAIADEDEKKYEQAKAHVVKTTEYSAEDFDEGGPLYGWSTNELIEVFKDGA
jgi:predicted phage tail protein